MIPVDISLVHGVILHRPAVTGNWELPQRGTKTQKKRMPHQCCFSCVFVFFVAMVFLPANLREGKAFFPGCARR